MNVRKTKSEIKDFILNNRNHMKLREIAQLFNISEGTVGNYQKELGINIRGDWTDLELQFVKDNATNMTRKEIAEKLDRKITGVSRICRNLNLQSKRPRSYDVNDYFFHTLTPDSAYILGLMISDGCVRCIGPKKKILIYSISAKDRELIEFVRDKISPTKTIEERTRIKNSKEYYELTLRINSVILVDKLIEYGVVPNKTGKEYIPDIDKEFWPYIIRGIFDGDGSVYYKDSGKILVDKKCYICSANDKLLEQIKDYFGFGSITGYSKNFYYWSLNSYENIINFYNIIYNDFAYKLDRKFQKVKYIKEHKNG